MTHVFLSVLALFLVFPLSTTTLVKRRKCEHQPYFRDSLPMNKIHKNLPSFEHSFATTTRTKRVIYGTFANRDEFPSMVAIISHRCLICGGSLITERHVLTAAHCLYGEEVKYVHVLLNTFYLPDYVRNVANVCSDTIMLNGTTIHAISNIKIHENYDVRRRLVNDIAIMTIVKTPSLQYGTSPGLRPATLQYSQSVAINTRLVMPGFGRTESRDHIQRLKKLEMIKARIHECLSQFGLSNHFVALMQICAIRVNGAVAEGDSGSPVFIRNPQNSESFIQIGILSGRAFDNRTAGSARFQSLVQIHTKQIVTSIKFFKEWIIRWTQDHDESTATLC